MAQKNATNKTTEYIIKDDYANTKLVFNSYFARLLLHRGNPIIDILKNHNLDNSVVFVFEKTDKFNKDFIECLSEVQVMK